MSQNQKNSTDGIIFLCMLQQAQTTNYSDRNDKTVSVYIYVRIFLI